MTGTPRHVQVHTIAALAMGYLVGLAAYSRLPGPFLAERLGARIMVAFTLPTTALVIDGLYRSLWKHDRIRTGNGAFEAAYRAIVLRTVLFVLALHTLVMLALTHTLDATGVQLPASRAVVVLLGLMLAAVGNLLPRTRPNVAMGVRTAKTLANGQLWQRVHRAGGYVTVGLGLFIVAAGLLMSHQAMAAVIGAAAMVAAGAVLMSYRRYVRA